MSKNLVSIITPCYNGEKYISKLLDSVLSQTYSSIEMFIIDDGSTDKSADIIKAYIPKFKKRGFNLEYIYQPNQGQSVAINNALKMVKGDYVVWPDADDYYATPETIEKMVNLLNKTGDDTSMVRVYYNVLDEKDNKIGSFDDSDATRYKTDLFEDCLFEYGKGFWGVAGGYMAKMSKVDERIPGREIYTERHAGQNYQLALPLLYKYKCVTIEEYLYNLVVHDDSHSRNLSTGDKRQMIYRRTIKKTLSTLALEKEYKKYLLKRIDDVTEKNMVKKPKFPYRTYLKRIVRGVLPHGIIVLYRRGR